MRRVLLFGGALGGAMLAGSLAAQAAQYATIDPNEFRKGPDPKPEPVKTAAELSTMTRQQRRQAERQARKAQRRRRPNG